MAARHQLLGLGPLAALLRDPASERIRVLTTRAEALGNGRWASDELDYASPEAAQWALARLLRAGGAQPEATGIVKLELPHGWTLHAITGGRAAAGPMFELVRVRDDVPSLRDLCLDGALSSDMAEWIESALARRANFFIACERHSGADTLTRSVAAAVPNPEQTLWLTPPDTGVPDEAATLSLDADPHAQEQAVAGLEEISCPYLVAPFLTARPFAALSQLMLRGRRGVLAACWGHTLVAALELASAALMDAHPALDRRAAHARLAASFDVALELCAGADGHLRFTRLAELQPADEGTLVRDLFRFSGDDAGFRAMLGETVSPPPTTDRSA